MISHGMSRSPEFRAWVSARFRCINPNDKDYEYYGGRGISVCDRWSKFENFYKDMGLRPSDSHSLDRIDSNGNYEPDNCRWATWTQQARNHRVRNTNKSGTSGVFFVKNKNWWRATIRCNYKHISLGCFAKLENAVKARLDGEKKYWGNNR